MSNPYAASSVDFSPAHVDGETAPPAIFALKGRIGRVRYLAYLCGMAFVIAAVLAALFTVTGSDLRGKAFNYTLTGVIALVSLVLARRRLNDMDYSGWVSLLVIVPFIGRIFSLILVFKRGSEGANEYGPAPGPNSRGLVIAAWAFVAVSVIGIVAAVAIPAYSTYQHRTGAQAGSKF